MMEPESVERRVSTGFVVAMLVMASFFLVVAFAPATQAAVTTGVTDDYVPASSRYIRDDSTAIPIWAFGASSNMVNTDRLWEVRVWFDMSGTGLSSGDFEGLSTDARFSGVGLYRDVGVDDVFDAADIPITVSSCQWFWSWPDQYCRLRLNGVLEWVPNALQGNYQWFIVIRTDWDISDSDVIRTWINANEITYSDGSSQPAAGVTGSTLDVRESRYNYISSGGMVRNDEEAVLGLDIVDGGPYETFDYVRVRFQNGGGFDQTDLAAITTNPANSGVALYRNDGDGSWDPGDTGLVLSSTSVSWPWVYLYPNNEGLPDRPLGAYEYWVVVRTSGTINNGDTFTVYGDTGSIRIDGTPNFWNDQDVFTPENWNDDWGPIVCDLTNPSISSVRWSEGSMYLHAVGSTLYFSDLMSWTQSATLTCNCWDGGSGVHYVSYSSEPSLGAGSYNDYWSPYQRSFSIDAPDTDTSSPVDVTVYDGAGNSASSNSATYVEDTTAPSVTITSPPDLDTLSGTVQVTATVTDSQSGVRANSVYVSWDFWWTWNIMVWDGSQYVYNMDTTLLADGDYRISVRADDNVDNQGSAFVNVKVDNTGPASTIVSPSAGQYVHSGNDLYVWATASDASPISGMWARLGAGGWTAMTYEAVSGLYWANLGAPGAGNLNVQAYAVDTEGNTGPTASVVAIGDANDPTVSVASHSGGDEVMGTITIQVSAADTEALDRVEVYLASGTTSLTLVATLNPATGYYEVTVDTTTLPEGSWGVAAAAFDEAGRFTTTAAFTITVDNTEPTLAILQPAGGAYLYGTFTVRAAASDTGSGFDVGGLALSVDGGAWSPMTDSGGGIYTYDLDTTGLSDGGHTITVAAVDDAGNIAVRVVSVYVDNTPPNVAVAAPSLGDYVEGTYTFAVSAVDNMGIANVSAVIVGPAATIDVALGFNAASGYYEWAADTTGWADGDYTIKPYATELTGRAFTTAATVRFSVDNNAPVVSVSSPRDGEVILTDTYDVAISADDGPFALLAGQVRYRVDAGPWTSMTAGAGSTWTHTWDTTGVVDGDHQLTFRVTDTAGHVTTETVAVTVDNNDPTCMIAVPSGGQFLAGVVTFAVKATDALGVAKVDMDFSGIGGLGTVGATFNPSTGYWEYVLDTTTVTDADGSLRATSTDASGRTATAPSVSFRIDNHAPTLVVGAPMDGEVILNATYDVGVQADDVSFGLGPGDVKWRVDANPWSDMNAVAGGWSVNWFTSDYADGTHTLHFRAIDAAGHVTEEAITVTVDNNDPTVALNTPSAGEFVGGVYTFSARAADSLGVSTVELHFGFSGTAPLSVANATYDPSSGYWELTVDTTTLPDGPASLVLVATDTSGRMTTSALHPFAVDNNAPELSLVNPLPGDILLGGMLRVEVDASDEGFTLGPGDVEYSLDGTGWADMTNASGTSTQWILDLNTSWMADGEHTLAYRVTDGAGHVTSAGVAFVVDNTDPVCRVVTPAAGEFAMGVYFFRVAATDALGIEGVQLTFEGAGDLTGAEANFNPASGLWEFLIDTSTLDDASAAASAVATDTSGRTSGVAGPVNFTIDNHPPVVAFVSPTEGQVITEGEHTINVSAQDMAFGVAEGAVHLSIDGGGWGPMTPGAGDGFEYSWNTSAASDGEHNLRVKAGDEAGHVSQVSLNVVVDNHDPALAIVAPTEGQFATGVLNFQVASSDARGIVEVTVDWSDGAPVAATINAATNYYEHKLDTTTLPDGTYNLTARALDGSGRASEARVTFQVDNHEPELTFEGPLSGEILDGEVTVRAGAQDAFVDSLQFSVDGVGWVDLEDGEGTFDSTRFSDGEHTITVRAIDGSGKATTASSVVTIDNTAPVVSVADFPSMNEHLAGEVVFALFASDIVGVEAVTVTVDGEDWPVYLNPSTGFYEWTFDSAAMPDGFYDMVFTAEDAAGHNSSVSWTVFADNTAPVVSDQRPKDRTTVEGTVTFRTTVTDESDVESVLLRIGRRLWVTMTEQSEGVYVYEWETTSEDDAEGLEYTVRVTDELGNSAEETSTITVDNPGNWVFLVLLVILIVLIVVAIYWTRTRRGPGDEGEVYTEDELEEITAEVPGLDELEGANGQSTSAENIAEEVEMELVEREPPE